MHNLIFSTVDDIMLKGGIVLSSLASQTPYFSEEREKGSGNTAYNVFYLAKECGATNDIASLLIIIRH